MTEEAASEDPNEPGVVEVGVADPVREGVLAGVELAVPVPLFVPLAVDDGVGVDVREPVEVPVLVPVPDGEDVPVSDDEGVDVGAAVCEELTPGETVAVFVGDTDGVLEEDDVPLDEMLAVADTLDVDDRVTVGVDVGVCKGSLACEERATSGEAGG